MKVLKLWLNLCIVMKETPSKTAFLEWKRVSFLFVQIFAFIFFLKKNHTKLIIVNAIRTDYNYEIACELYLFMVSQSDILRRSSIGTNSKLWPRHCQTMIRTRVRVFRKKTPVPYRCKEVMYWNNIIHFFTTQYLFR